MESTFEYKSWSKYNVNSYITNNKYIWMEEEFMEIMKCLVTSYMMTWYVP